MLVDKLWGQWATVAPETPSVYAHSSKRDKLSLEEWKSSHVQLTRHC